MQVQVNNIDQLYAALDLATNAGNEIVLSPGIYKLDASKGANSGRIEFQKDMTLRGVEKLPDLVIIDTSNLPNASFNPPFNIPARRTGAIRMGRGTNKLAWLKVIGNSNAQPLSVIDTDLVWAGISKIIISNTIITGGRIGINLRNVGPTCVGRIIEAEIKDNEIMGNLVSDAGTQQGQGIVMQNANGASNAIINARLNANYIHGNIRGMRVFNNNGNPSTKQDNASITIQSNGDRFEENQLGINLDAGFNMGAGSTAKGNTIIFEAQGTSIQNNRGIIPDTITLPCGIRLVGGSNSIAGSEASGNKLIMKLTGCKMSGNQDVDIRAYGAFSTITTLAGTNNVVEIILKGVSKNATVLQDDSLPNEPAGTNKVVVTL